MERSIMLLIGKPSISISHLYHGYVKITRWYQTLPNWSLYVHFLLNSTGGIRSSYFRVSIMRPAWLHVWGKVQASSAQIKKSLSNNLPEILVEWHLYHSLYIPISWSGFMRGDNIFCCQSPHHPPLGGSPFLSNCFASARIVTGNIWEPGWTRDWNGWTQFSGTSLWILIHEQSEIWICSPTEMIPKNIAGIALLLVARRQFHCLPRELRQRHETLHEFAPPGGNQAGMFFQPGAMV